MTTSTQQFLLADTQSWMAWEAWSDVWEELLVDGQELLKHIDEVTAPGRHP